MPFSSDVRAIITLAVTLCIALAVACAIICLTYRRRHCYGSGVTDDLLANRQLVRSTEYDQYLARISNPQHYGHKLG